MINRFLSWLLPHRPRFKPEENDFSLYLRKQTEDSKTAIEQRQTTEPVTARLRGIPQQRSFKDGWR